MGICELDCGYLAPAVQAKMLGLGFPPSLGLENFILLGLVRSRRPCVARAAEMILKSVGSEEELGCGVHQREERGIKGGMWGSESMKNQERSLEWKSIQLK